MCNFSNILYNLAMKFYDPTSLLLENMKLSDKEDAAAKVSNRESY